MSRVFFAQLNAQNYEREILGLELAFYIFAFVNTFLVNVYNNKKLNKYHHHGANCADDFHLHFEAD